MQRAPCGRPPTHPPATHLGSLLYSAAEAWRFAPIVYNHQLERYHLQSPDTWWNASEVYYIDYQNRSRTDYSWVDSTPLRKLMFKPK